MSTEKIYQSKFLPVAKYLLKELEYYGENQFKRKTTASEWTIGQLYHHIVQGSHDYHMKAIKDCLEKKNGATEGGKTFYGFLVFMLGAYPAIKVKGQPGYSPLQIESPEKAKDMMFGYLKEMNRLAMDIDKRGQKEYKIKHPRLGFLSADEWYRLIVIHQKHHLKQKNKIDKILRTFVKDEDYSNVTSVAS